MILVTGATGYIGSRLVKRLVKDGNKVRALVVKNDPLMSNLKDVDCEVVKGDITQKETLRLSFEGIKTVFHLAAVLVSHRPDIFYKINYEGTKNVVNTAIECNVEHFVYLSAAAAAYKERTSYGESKLKSESLMQEKKNTKFTIVRPTIIYGEGGSQELKIYIENINRVPFFLLLVGGGKARKRPVCINDVVDGLALIANNQLTYEKIYNFSGGTDISMRDFTALICKTFGIRRFMVSVPMWLSYFLAGILKMFVSCPVLRKDTILGVTMDANFSFKEAKNDIGYNPISIEEGFNKYFSKNQKWL
jgi:NADH dehydrogenase